MRQLTWSPCQLSTGHAALLCPHRWRPHRVTMLRLVPDDVGFCLVVQNFRGFDAVSPLFVQLRSSPRFAAGLSAGSKTVELEEQLKQHLQVPWPQSATRSWGYRRPGVSAYRRPTNRKKNRISWSSMLGTPKCWRPVGASQCPAKTIRRPQTSDSTHHGVSTHIARSATRSSSALRGPLLAISTKEAMLLRVIDRERRARQGSTGVRQRARLGVESCRRPFGEPTRVRFAAGQKAAAPPAEALIVGVDLPKALDGMALAVQMHHADVELGLTFLAKEGDPLQPGFCRRLANVGVATLSATALFAVALIRSP